MFPKSGYSLLGDPASNEGIGAKVRNCLTFFSTRVFRGRARLIIALVVLFNLVFLVLLPDRLSGVFGHEFGTLLRFRGGEDRHGGGGLRIVSFGSPDLAMGSERRNSGNSKSWTEYLCDEVSFLKTPRPRGLHVAIANRGNDFSLAAPRTYLSFLRPIRGRRIPP